MPLTTTTGTRECPRCHMVRGIDAFRWMGGRQQRRHPWCSGCERAANALRRRNRRSAAPVVEPRIAARFIGRNRRFGIEIEFVGDRWAVAEALRLRGIQARVEGYSHATPSAWKVITDSSCGSELVSPVLEGEDGRRQVRVAMEALRAAGATINKSCGLHVHHDARGLSLENLQALARTFAAAEDRLFEVVAPSRRSNVYCRRFRGSSVADKVERAYGLAAIQRISGRDRYHAINFAAYGRHGTVEVRMHQATLNGTKAVEWVLLGQAIVEAAVNGEAVDASTMSALVGSLRGLDESDRDYFVGRAAVFARRAGR